MPQGLLTRGPAFVLDSLLVSLILSTAVGNQLSLTRMIIVAAAAELLYFFAFESLLGTTPGKRVFGLRVVRASDGRPCGPWPAAVRTVMRLVDSLLLSPLPGMYAIMTSPRRQRFGDRAAGTLVVSEVPEQLLTVFRDGPVTGAPSPEQVMRRLGELAQRQAQGMAGADAPERAGVPEPASYPEGAADAAGGADAAGADSAAGAPAADLCPFCDHLMEWDEIVCRYCGHYVNQVSAEAETQRLAPVPMLYSEDRRHRFDALWRLVFAADEESLAAVRDAVPGWTAADRLLAIQIFAAVDDRRPIAFLDFMVHDSEPAVVALARDVRRLLESRGSDEG